jgi:hypothetical protein
MSWQQQEKMNDLISAVKSKRVKMNSQHFTNFDKTFLQLFPTFIPEFSALLIDDCNTIEGRELLNT